LSPHLNPIEKLKKKKLTITSSSICLDIIRKKNKNQQKNKKRLMKNKKKENRNDVNIRECHKFTKKKINVLVFFCLFSQLKKIKSNLV